jgi:hypothetical protein
MNPLAHRMTAMAFVDLLSTGECDRDQGTGPRAGVLHHCMACRWRRDGLYDF